MINYIISIIAVILIGIGIFFVLSYLYQTPTLATASAIKSVVNINTDEKESFLSKMFHGISKKIAPHITLNPSTKYKVQLALDYQHYTSTAEEHCVEAASAGVLVGLLVSILGVINPIFIIFGVVGGFLIFRLEFEGPLKEMDKIRENINNDSSLMAKFIADSLKDENRNVVEILTSCKNSVSNDYKNELETTITELKTINQETALTNMSKRLNSPNVTQIVMGLLGVLRGDDQTLYFETLADKFYKAELAEIKKKNSLKPGQISKVTMILLVAVIAQILVGMVLSLMATLSEGGLF